MKSVSRVLAAIGVFTALGVGTASATTIKVVDDANDSYPNIGDYYVIEGSSLQSSPGQVLDVLKLTSPGSSTTETGTNNVEIGDIYDYLIDQGGASANKLLFGLGVSEDNKAGDNQVDVTALSMTFNLPNGGGTKTFNLGDNIVRVVDWNNGGSGGDVLIGIDLGFDFFKIYTDDSADLFTITSTIENATGGFELYFLDSSLFDLGNGDSGGLGTAPEPASLALFGTGLAFIANQVRRRKKQRP